MYAVNVADLTNRSFDKGCFNVAGMLINPVQGDIVDAEPKQIDGHALTLNCDDERALAIIQVLRMKANVRAYKQGPRGGWKSI